ncbi:UNKNOWN [Stylonychia lemnae]|uniref:tRNA-uridine aminocarboxypropyltransferase 1 n=1 Tax=Stylonychia lemnae TaxID=5949 RepID=A0A078A0U2_STYLE|nr:UNKNOWN [Stylonychia lemnae]|eukprot:CDW75755.1 UNKNOWN [Stylonychia lemnae]
MKRQSNTMEKKGQEEEEVKEQGVQKRQKLDQNNQEKKIDFSVLNERQDQQQSYIDKLKLNSFNALIEMKGRKDCPKCKCSRKYFCYDCYIPLNDDLATVPRVDLPIEVTVYIYLLELYFNRLRHPKEKISKSSIVASKIVAPEKVQIVHEMDISSLRDDDEDYDSVVLLFPTDDAQEVIKMSEEELAKIKKVVIIDCTWNQTHHFLKQANVKKIKKIKIQTEKTVFWRYQRISEANLATIEALYYFFRDYDVNKNCSGDYAKYDGKYDNLLYYYAFNYKLIQYEYVEGSKKDKKFIRMDNYIKGRDEPEQDTKHHKPAYLAQNDKKE